MNARVPALVAAASLSVAVSGAAAASGDEAPARVASDARWTPPADFVAAMHRACDGSSGDFGACFVRAMEKAGAPAAALAFARRTGDQGYLEEFRATGGLVDVAVARYPFRANENSVCFLVNGAPPLIDVDDPRYLDRDALRGDPGYAAILRAHPNAAVFPGPRAKADAVRETRRPDGGQVFGVPYALTDGCHACARIGALTLDFDFDPSGRLAGTRVASVRADGR
ncbi:MAG TPA: hypothetical protein VFA98_10710 [Thermoanaerobaculia bacterium]|jgi:hypothetical protein|nr:hypothetical protein [Thermoanaerobaculia bacterium]